MSATLRAPLLWILLAVLAQPARAFGGDGPVGVWEGVYHGYGTPADAFPIRVAVQAADDDYRAEITLPEDGLTIVDHAPGVIGSVLNVSGIGQAAVPGGGAINIEIELTGLVEGNEWSGTLISRNADDDTFILEGDFTMNRGTTAGGSRKQPAQPRPPAPARTARQTPPPAPPTPAGKDAVSDPNLAQERAVWLRDSLNAMNFAVILVPPGWRADGGVGWNYVYRANPKTVYVNLVNPARNIGIELVLQPGAFTWSADKARFINVRDGAFMVDTGVFNLEYRNARTLLSELLGPGIARQLGGRVLQVREFPDGAKGAAEAARSRAEVERRAGRPVTGSEGTAAEMTILYSGADGTPMRATVLAQVSAVQLSTLGGTVEWNIDSLIIVTAPENDALSPDELGSILSELRFNPEWRRRTNARLAELAAGGMAAARAAQREIGDRIRRTSETHQMLADKFRRALTQESVYRDPVSGDSYVVPNDAKYAIIDPLDNTIIRSSDDLDRYPFPSRFRKMELVED